MSSDIESTPEPSDELHRRSQEAFASDPAETPDPEDHGGGESRTLLQTWVSTGGAGGNGAGGNGAYSWSSTAWFSYGTGSYFVGPYSSVGVVHPSEPIKLDTEITAGELIAWRVWRIEGDDLHSMAVNTLWLPGVPMQGDVGQHVGVHAWKTKADARKYAQDAGGWQDASTVLGTVELWGEVIDHEVGYRASFAQIMSVKEIRPRGYGNAALLRRLQQRYCPKQPPAAIQEDDSADWTGPKPGSRWDWLFRRRA